MMMNDSDIVSKFKATIRILFVFNQIIVWIIRIQPNSKYLLFSTVPVFLTIIVKHAETADISCWKVIFIEISNWSTNGIRFNSSHFTARAYVVQYYSTKLVLDL